jgi:hypothetical protein
MLHRPTPQARDHPANTRLTPGACRLPELAIGRLSAEADGTRRLPRFANAARSRGHTGVASGFRIDGDWSRSARHRSASLVPAVRVENRSLTVAAPKFVVTARLEVIAFEVRLRRHIGDRCVGLGASRVIAGAFRWNGFERNVTPGRDTGGARLPGQVGALNVHSRATPRFARCPPQDSLRPVPYAVPQEYNIPRRLCFVVAAGCGDQ